MNTPLKAYTVNFTADGLSTSLEIDASILPVGDDFRGNIPQAVLLPSVTSTFTGALAGVTATLAGTTVTITFLTAPPKLDGNSNLIIYTASFYLQFGD